MGIILKPIAQILFFLVGFINTPIKLWNLRKKHGFFKAYSKTQFESAKAIDIFGNEQYSDTWNLLLSKGGYKFGVKGETISSACGKKQLERSLSIGGWILVLILWFIDIQYWFEGGHCVNSIDK